MGWTTPRTWTTGETVTAAEMNTHVRDNDAYLKTEVDSLTTWKASYPDAAWAEMTLQNSWVKQDSDTTYGAARYMRRNGIVYINIFITSGTVANGTVVGSVPAGFRPSVALQFAGYTYAPFGAAGWRVESGGDLTIYGAQSTWVAGNFAFPAEG